jgi:hypothetical protein
MRSGPTERVDRADPLTDRHDPGAESPRRAPTLGGQEARQGRIVLNTPARRWIFFSGLVGLVVLAVLLAVLF